MTRCPPAGLERRFHAALLDLVAVGLPAAAVAYAGWSAGLGLPVGLGLAAAVLVAGAVLVAVALGLTGASPGRAALGIRVLRADGAGPLGARDALLRAALVAGVGVPTLGTGLAVLAWTALLDPAGRRRGWHDRRVGSAVLDVRTATGGEPEPAPAPPELLNLTTQQLLPAPAAPDADASEAPAPGGPAARWRVRFDTGETFLVEGLTLLGRAPEPARGEPVQRRVTRGFDGVATGTHAQLQVVAGRTLVVMDRGSGDGTVLVRGRARRELVPGRATTLLAHDRVCFGERVMEVTREA
nr:RDD family protein [Nocardioides sp. zg-DK7169]